MSTTPTTPSRVFVVQRTPIDARSTVPLPERVFALEADAKAYVAARQPDYPGARFRILPLPLETEPAALVRVYTLEHHLPADGSPGRARTRSEARELTSATELDAVGTVRTVSHRDGSATLRVQGTDEARCGAAITRAREELERARADRDEELRSLLTRTGVTPAELARLAATRAS